MDDAIYGLLIICPRRPSETDGFRDDEKSKKPFRIVPPRVPDDKRRKRNPVTHTCQSTAKQCGSVSVPSETHEKQKSLRIRTSYTTVIIFFSFQFVTFYFKQSAAISKRRIDRRSRTRRETRHRTISPTEIIAIVRDKLRNAMTAATETSGPNPVRTYPEFVCLVLFRFVLSACERDSSRRRAACSKTSSRAARRAVLLFRCARPSSPVSCEIGRVCWFSPNSFGRPRELSVFYRRNGLWYFCF